MRPRQHCLGDLTNQSQVMEGGEGCYNPGHVPAWSSSQPWRGRDTINIPGGTATLVPRLLDCLPKFCEGRQRLRVEGWPEQAVPKAGAVLGGIQSASDRR